MPSRRIMIATVVVAAAFIGCKEQQKHEDKAVYKTAVVDTTSVTLQQEFSASLTGRQIVEIRPQVSGNITKICIDEGQQVRQGQTLFIIDQVPYRAALQVAQANVKSAEARLTTAQMNYDSDTKLHENQVVSDFTVQTSRNALLEAQAALAQAQAQEANARWQLSYTEVKSPVSGSASMIPWHVGSLVSSNMSEPLVTVADDHEMLAYFSITENQALAIMQEYGSFAAFISQSPGVSLRLSNGTLYDHQGHIDAVSGTVDTSTGAVNLRATFPNPERLLHNGSSATVVLPSNLSGCIVLPQEATYELQNRIFVYKVTDGRTKSAPVEVFRLNNGREYVVESGLQRGDTIVAEGAGLLKEGVEL